MTLVLAAVGGAWGMPAVFATRPGESAVNHHSVVVVSTSSPTITVAVDVQGDARGIGQDVVLLVPLLGGSTMLAPNLLDPWAAGETALVTSPRLVDWDCEELVAVERVRRQGAGCGWIGGARLRAGPTGDTGRAGLFASRHYADQVLAEPVPVAGPGTNRLFELGERNQPAVADWLSDQGFVLPAEALAELEGVPVAALQVELDRVPREPTWLNALVITVAVSNGREVGLAYDLADLSSAPTQEELLIVLAPEPTPDLGPGVAVVPAPSRCSLHLGEDETFDQAWERVRQSLLVDAPPGAWLREAWSASTDCAVCTTTPNRQQGALSQVRAGSGGYARFARMRTRGEPSGPITLSLSRFAEADAPETDPLVFAARPGISAQHPDCLDGTRSGEVCPGRGSAGCRTAPGAWWLLAAVVALGWRRRR